MASDLTSNSNIETVAQPNTYDGEISTLAESTKKSGRTPISSKKYRSPSLIQRLRRFGAIGSVCFLVILICESGSWALSFKGATYFVDHHIALIFATAVQLCIMGILYSIDRPGIATKVLLFLAYAVCFTFSVGSAYVTTFNTSSNSARIDANRARLAQEAGRFFSQIETSFSQQVVNLRQRISALEIAVEEEEKLGGRSGRGSGKGVRYYEKLEELNKERVALDELEKKEDEFDSAKDSFFSKAGNEDRMALLTRLREIEAALPSTVRDEVNTAFFGEANDEYEKTAHLIALRALVGSMDRAVQTQAFISLLPAATLEFLALFMGFVAALNRNRPADRRPDGNYISRIRRGIIVLVSEIYRFKDIGKDSTSRAKKDSELEELRVGLEFQMSVETLHKVVGQQAIYSLSSEQLREYWKSLVVAAAVHNRNSPGEVLFEVVANIKPLPGGVQGIERKFIEEQYPAVATFLQTERLLTVSTGREGLEDYLILNADRNYDKYQILLRSAAMLSQLTGEPMQHEYARTLLTG